MATTSKQRLALAICDFLTKSLSDGTVSADDKDSIDVAINCISESFKVDTEDSAAVTEAVGGRSLLQVFTAYEAIKTAAKPAASKPAASDSAPAPLTPERKKEADDLKSKGNAAMAKREYAQAVELYTSALEIDPKNSIFLSNRAAAHSANQDHESARVDAEAAVAIDPKYTKAWSRLGLARFALGDPSGAMEAYQKGIENEGNGGSEAMKKGYETARRCVAEIEAKAEAESATTAPTTRSAPAAAGGMPDLASMFGGGAGGGGGMPDFASIMSNPMFQSMAQSLMSNPEMMQNLMSNPRLREMASQMGAGGGMPDLNAMMSDPNIAEMARSMLGGAGRGNPPSGPGAGP